MKLIVVANAKGGCGKTTLATTLAGLIAASGGRTALADLDPSRCALAWLARRPARARPVLAFDWTRRSPQRWGFG
jgi:chromosome partitioning protein